MTWIANAELAAAVSNAGGLGLISPNAGTPPVPGIQENLRNQIRKAKALTDKPFGVNIPLAGPAIRELIDVVIEEGIRVMSCSAGNPRTHTQYLKDAGVTVLHVIASVKHAQGAEAAGVDAVIAEGYEAGGHNGFDEITTFTLVPQVVDAVKIPVVAAGGIADARGFVAALALGADGVQMGTCFITTSECIAHPNFKEAVLQMNDTGTVISGRKLGPTRGIKTRVTDQVLEMEARGASAEELQEFLGPGRARQGQLDGDLDNGEGYCGSIAGMIKEIVSAGEVVRRIVEDSTKVIAGLQ